MPRPEKVQAVAEIKERFERARAVFLAEYAGLSVKDQQALRRSLRAQGAEFKVVKMTLARRAAAELDIDGIDDLLLGPTGLAFADDDAVNAAKALKDFAKDHEVFAIKGGLLGPDLLTPERVSELAEIEPRDVLLAKLAGAMQAPMAKMAGLLAAMPRNFATMLQQLIDQRPEEAPEPEAEGATVAPEPEEPEPESATEATEAEEAAEPEPEAEEAAEPEPEAEEAEPEAEEAAEPGPESATEATGAEEAAEPEPEAPEAEEAAAPESATDDPPADAGDDADTAEDEMKEKDDDGEDDD